VLHLLLYFDLFCQDLLRFARIKNYQREIAQQFVVGPVVIITKKLGNLQFESFRRKTILKIHHNLRRALVAFDLTLGQ